MSWKFTFALIFLFGAALLMIPAQPDVQAQLLKEMQAALQEVENQIALVQQMIDELVPSYPSLEEWMRDEAAHLYFWMNVIVTVIGFFMCVVFAGIIYLIRALIRDLNEDFAALIQAEEDTLTEAKAVAQEKHQIMLDSLKRRREIS